jgi:hypothetical protein
MPKLTQVYKCEDKYDQILINKCLFLVMDNNTEQAIKIYQKEIGNKNINANKYVENIFNAIDSIVKAKHQWKMYQKLEKKVIKKIKKQIGKSKAVYDQGFAEPEVISHFDAYLTQLKTALDSLALAIGSLYGFHPDGWHKGKNEKGERVSGLRLINALENLGIKQQRSVELILNYIKEQIPTINKLVFLRDGSVHKKGDRKREITDFVYYQNNEVIQPPLLITDDGNFLVSKVMERSLDYFCNFTLIVIILSLSNLTPLMKPVIDEKNEKVSWLFNFKEEE